LIEFNKPVLLGIQLVKTELIGDEKFLIHCKAFIVCSVSQATLSKHQKKHRYSAKSLLSKCGQHCCYWAVVKHFHSKWLSCWIHL